jgi:AraC-like DNA-binding protein
MYINFLTYRQARQFLHDLLDDKRILSLRWKSPTKLTLATATEHIRIRSTDLERIANHINQIELPPPYPNMIQRIFNPPRHVTIKQLIKETGMTRRQIKRLLKKKISPC